MSLLKFDLIQSILKYVDPHLGILLLEHYENNEKSAFDSQLLNVNKLLVLIRTKIIDYINSECDKIDNEQTKKIKVEFEKIKEITESNAGSYMSLAQTFIDFYTENAEELKKERFSRNAYAKLPTFENFARSDFANTAKLARCLFDIGNYPDSLEYLNAIQNIIDDDELHLSVLWGKTLAEICVKNIAQEEAKEAFKVLRNKIDTMNFAKNMELLANRTFLLHTSLFIYLHAESKESDLESLVELFTNEHYLNTIQMTCPHLIRYLASSLLLLKNAGKFGSYNLSDLISLLQRETCDYSDSLIDFLKSTLIEFDFKGAKEHVKKIKNDLKYDFFVGKRANNILNGALNVLFEEYCKIHSTVEIKFVGEFLEVSDEEAEIWLVKLIRNAGIEARIDSEKSIIVISKSKTNFYEEAAAKTRDLIPRTNLLVNNIKRIIGTTGN